MTDEAVPPIGRLTWGLAAAATVAILALITISVLFTSRRVSTPTMSPAVAEGDSLLVSRSDDTPALGDIVVWDAPVVPGVSGSFVHRVVGLGGDRLEAVDGVLRRNGEVVAESYLAPGTITDGLPLITIPDGMMFLLADRRETSLDSRRLGAVSITATIGVVKATGPRWHVVLGLVSVAMTLLTMISYLAGRSRPPVDADVTDPLPIVFPDSLPAGPPPQ
jgi:signal peptidase I